MLIVYHNKEVVTSIELNDLKLSFDKKKSLIEIVFQLSEVYSEEWVVWCDLRLRDFLNIGSFDEIFNDNRMLQSYSLDGTYIVSDNIHFIDSSHFVNPNRNVRFASILMSSNVGGIHASILNIVNRKKYLNDSFSYFLCSLSKQAMPEGLFCYSNPNLLREYPKALKNDYKTDILLDYKFIRQHWKKRWLVMFFLNILFFQRKLTLVPLLKSFFYQKRKLQSGVFESTLNNSKKENNTPNSFDVIIPTIGRKDYLYDVLNDLREQKLKPKKVIIVEQNADQSAMSELDFLQTENFPFVVKHIFIYRTGACNARNIALNEIESDWIFLADDDIRFSSTFLLDVKERIGSSKLGAFSVSCLQKDEKEETRGTIQSAIFGSANSFIINSVAKKCRFDLNLEHGYGEDTDFGMQIRNLGVDVYHMADIQVFHLKAPVGGFRTKPILPWHGDDIQPKPSPTVMIYNLKYLTKKQIQGFKLQLAMKYYKFQSIKNPIKYLRKFNLQWATSQFWAKKIMMDK